MPTQKFVNRGVRKITRVGRTSLAVTLPKDMLTELGWREKQKVVVKKIRGGIQIKDWRALPPRPLGYGQGKRRVGGKK